MQGEIAIGQDPAAGSDLGGDEILIVMNPHSGKKRTGEKARQLREEVGTRPGRFVIREAAKGSEIEAMVKRAVAEGFRTIAAAGGDGTICAVASALAGTGCRMGVVPLGTFNYFARGHGLPETVPEALQVLADTPARPIDIADVNGHVFLNNASLGAYAKVLESRERIYRRYGRSRFAAYWSVVVALLNFRTRLVTTVTVDGEVHRFKTPMIFVANNPFQLELFNLAGADLIREGKLVALVAPDVGRWGLIAFAIRLALGGMDEDRDFKLLAGRDILVETRRRGTVVARDGERGRLKAPFRFRLRAGALELVAPPPAPPAPAPPPPAPAA
jgi:diacylglycerol kinase family enzyme